MSDETMVLRSLTVTSCDEKYRGTNAKGEYVIYEVAALDHDGAPVPEDLRSFDSLPLGEEREYEVTPYDHPKYGRSYTLKLVGGAQKSPGARLGPKVDALREQVESQDERIGRLEQRISELEGRLQGGASPGLQSAGSRFGDEVPF